SYLLGPLRYVAAQQRPQRLQCRSRQFRQTAPRTLSKYVWSAMSMAGAGGDLTTTVVTTPTRTILVTAIGVIIIATTATTTTTTTTNDDKGSGAYEYSAPP